MTSKVWELRKKIYDDAVTGISELASSWGTSEYLAENHMKRVAVDLDSLISAAHAEGVAEGAEQAVNQIRFHSGHYTEKGDTVMSEYVSPRAAVRAKIDLFIVPRVALASFVRPPTPVLAPTKESEKPYYAVGDNGESGESHA